MHVDIVTACTQEYGTKLNAQLVELTALVRSPLEENARRKVRYPSSLSCMCQKHYYIGRKASPLY